MNSCSKFSQHPLTASLYSARFSRLCVRLGVVLCSLLVTSTLNAGAIFKTVDKDGNIIFTDQALEGAQSHNKAAEEALQKQAEPVIGAAFDDNADPNAPPEDGDAPEVGEMPPDTVRAAPMPVNPPKSDYQAPAEPKPFLPVTVVEILTPVHNASLKNPHAPIWVELQSFPTPLKKTGLTAQLWMDEALISSGKRPLLNLPAPQRGTHRLQVKLVDDKGRLFLTSAPVDIHIK